MSSTTTPTSPSAPTSRKVAQLLERAGLQAAPWDPASLQALEDYLAQQQQQASCNTDADTATTPLLESPSRLAQMDIYSPTKQAEEEYETLPGEPPVTRPVVVRRRTLSAQDHVLEQMQLQTSILLDLQRQMEGLTARVKRLERIQPPEDARRVHRSAREKLQDDATGSVSTPPPPPQGNDETVAAAAPTEPRLVRLARVYLQRRRRDVPNFQWGLVFKALIILGILFSRIGGSIDDDDEEARVPYKFYALATVLLTALMLQTGYAQFLYRFIYQDQVPYQILLLNRDVPDVEPPVPGGRGGERDDAAAAWFDWRDTVLGGRIRRDAPGRQRATPWILRVLKEIGLLLISLVLSIFPMWHPEPHVPADEPPQAENPPPDGAPAAAERGLGAVQPPVDPAEPQEDDNEEEEEDEGEE